MNRTLGIYILFMIVSGMQTGCDSSDSRFYEDPSDKGLSIFSNNTNNIASAYFNDKVWRTRDRTYNILSSTKYEIHIQKWATTIASDTLEIRWRGDIQGQANYLSISLSFYMAVPKNFTATDLMTLKGQRFFADGVSSYFTVDGAPSLPTGKGTGLIYFHQVEIRLNPQADGSGKIAGLFEANFANLKITKGRFDHSLSPSHVQLP